MKIRLAKKIMKANLAVYPFYWHRRWTPYHLYVCIVNKPWGAKKDHRITKAISLTSKKKKNVVVTVFGWDAKTS